MKLIGTLAICLVVLAVAWLFVRLVGLSFEQDSVTVAVVVGAAIGFLIGGFTGVFAPVWLAPVLASCGIASMLLAFTQYNDDGPSGDLFALLLVLGLLILLGASVAAGMTLGSRLRRDDSARG